MQRHTAVGEEIITEKSTSALEMEDLQSQIAALERENKELREQNHKLASTQKMMPQVPRRYSAENNVKGMGGVYFDGYRTRFDHADAGDGRRKGVSQNNTSLPTMLPTIEVGDSDQIRQYSSISFLDVESDESERELFGDYIVDHLRGGERHPIKENELASRDGGSSNFLEKQQSFSKDKRPSLDLEASKKVDGGSGNPSDMISSGKHDFRRSSMLEHQSASALTFSSDGNKVYDFRGNDQVHFSLGLKKMNRYTLKVEEMLKLSDIYNNSSKNYEKDESASAQRPMLARAKTESNVVETSETEQWLPTKDRHSIPNPALSRDVEIFTKLNRTLSMCKMLSMRAIRPDSQPIEPHQRLSFQQFFLLSVDPLIDAEQDNLEWADGGTNFLDPFILKSSDCLDEFPCRLNRLNEESFAPEELSSFCCGDGVKIRLIPRCAVAGAQRLGWLGPEADQYKLLLFTDGNAMATHGVAITVSVQISVDHPGIETLVRTLQVQREKRLEIRAAAKIARWWRSAKQNCETTLASIPEKKKPNGRRRRAISRRLLHSPSSALRASATGGIKKMKKKIAIKKPTFKKGNKSQSNGVHGSDGCSDGENSHGSNMLSIEADSEHTPITKCAQMLGKESYKSMESITSMGDVVIVEKCYVLIGGDDSENFLQLRSLQHLVDMERYESEDNLKLGSQREVYRHEYLSLIQKRMCLSADQAKVQLPKNDLDILTLSPSTFGIDLPAFKGAEKISIPLPLPNCAKDWGVAAIVHHLEISDLLCILNLLLIERSVLVVGPDSDIVTSCTCALLELIRPFSWMSNFMPLIPVEMLDFVGSPVPFIIGMTIGHKAGDDIVEDQRVADAMKEGLSVINLAAGSVHLTTEAGIRSMVQHCLAPKSKLSHYKRRLETLRDDGACLGSFARFLKQGLSREEIITLNALRHLIHDHVGKFAGDVAERWRSYGNYTDGMFDFYPSLFIEPLRKQAESQLQLQEMISHSQLFIEFVDQQQKASVTHMNNTKGEIGRFIANWVHVHWRRRKTRENINR